MAASPTWCRPTTTTPSSCRPTMPATSRRPSTAPAHSSWRSSPPRSAPRSCATTAYWGPKALLDRTEFVFFTDIQPQILALQGGQIDVINQLPVLAGVGLLNDPNIDIIALKSVAHQQVHMRCDMDPFKDARVRRAIALCLDRPRIVQGLMKGRASLGNDSPFAAAYPTTDPSVPQRERDLAAGQAAGRSRRPDARDQGHADHRALSRDPRVRGPDPERGQGDRPRDRAQHPGPGRLLRRGRVRQVELARFGDGHHRLRPSRRAQRVPAGAA